jgi:hypothetical protein
VRLHCKVHSLKMLHHTVVCCHSSSSAIGANISARTNFNSQIPPGLHLLRETQLSDRVTVYNRFGCPCNCYPLQQLVTFTKQSFSTINNVSNVGWWSLGYCTPQAPKAMIYAMIKFRIIHEKLHISKTRAVPSSEPDKIMVPSLRHPHPTST